MHIVTGSPFQGRMLTKLRAFVHACGLDYDESIGFTAALMEDDEIIASGSLDGATVKCVAVAPGHQGEDLTGRIMTELLRKAALDGHTRLMLYTKPGNQYLFTSFGFHPVLRTADCLLMENCRNGLNAFLDGLPRPESSAGPIGCIVAHANPFTLGHRYLVETAAQQCAWVHLFILTEDRGQFSPEARLQMAADGCRDLPNVLVHASGPYMVSSATFPTYFLKDKARAEDIRCKLDVRLFGEKIAPALGITRRYVGTEPDCAVTAHYNTQLKLLLPALGVEVVEVPRLTQADRPISASCVRSLLADGRWDALPALVPESTLHTILAR